MSLAQVFSSEFCEILRTSFLRNTSIKSGSSQVLQKHQDEDFRLLDWWGEYKSPQELKSFEIFRSTGLLIIFIFIVQLNLDWKKDRLKLLEPFIRVC